MKRTVMLLAMMMMSLFSYAQIIQFADANFKNYLISKQCAKLIQNPNFFVNPDVNKDGEIQYSEAENIITLYFNANNIKSFKGLEYFINLERLDNQAGSLDSFTCINNQKIKHINLAQNNLKHLQIQNCKSLNTLLIYYNSISNQNVSLDNLDNLKYLNCSSTKIDTISFNLSNLERLSCAYSKYIDINKYKKLKDLRCQDYYGTILDLRYLDSLEYLDCWGADLKKLYINGLKKLEFINCTANDLDSLDLTGLINLSELRCESNNIEILNLADCVLLDELNCSYNNLKELDLSKCSKLTSLACYYNDIEYISVKNGSKENKLYIHTIPLKNICCDDNEIEFYKNYFSTVNNLPIFSMNTYCSFTPGGKFYAISGNTVLDLDNNVCDINDPIIPNLKFDISSINTNGYFISNTSGNYFIPVQLGTHNIKPILENPDYFNMSPDSISVTFPSTSDTIIHKFCITPKGILKQVDLSIIPTTVARPGFDTQYKVVMTNKGNQIENGTLYFAYDETKMDFVSTDVTPSTQSDGLLSWNFTDLLPFETRYYNVTLNVNSPSETPPVNVGDELLITCNILDNVFLLRQEVVGSYDPNDKTCLEGKTITPEQVGDYVHYLIRFENTGNYAAENVVVKDVIDATTFDISTLQITDASHEAWARINDNIVEFIFENIQLPFDDASNDGYICFKIKTKPTLVLGNELKNEANIYFDYNLPILTNKTNTVVANPVGTDEAVGESDIEIFPNPVSDVIKFSGDDKIIKVEIFDMSGRLVQVSNVVNGAVNVEGLLSGAYQMKVYTQFGVRNGKMVKI